MSKSVGKKTRRFIKVAIFDDHPLMIQSLVGSIQDDPEIEVVGTGAYIDDIVPTIKKTKPDVVILDLSMPKNKESRNASTDGIVEIIRKLKNMEIKTIIFSSHLIGFVIRQLNKGGIRAYIHKGDDMSLNSISAIKRVWEGGVFYSKTVSEELLKIESFEKFELSEQQLNLVQYFAENETNSNEQAAEYFVMSVASVKQHLRRVYNKLNIPEGQSKRKKMVEKLREVGVIA